MKGSTAFYVFVTTIISAVSVSDRLVSASIADNNVYDNEKDAICETSACIHEASFILGNMNSSVDPCENFYEFACGKFVQETIIPDDEDEVSLFSIINDKIEQQLRHLISADIIEDDQPAIKTMKSYYQTCMDTDRIEKNSKEDLQTILRQLGGCPALEGPSWDKEHFDWKRSVYTANKMGFDTVFFSMDVENDPDNGTRHITTIDQPSQILFQEIFVNDENDDKIKMYSELMINVFEALGVDNDQAEEEVNDVIDFERKLAKMFLSEKEREDQATQMTLHELETNYIGIPWKKYLNKILAPRAHLHRNDEVIVRAPSFLESLPRLLARTPKRVLANYICFQIISQSIDYVSTDISDIYTQFNESLSDIEEQLPRWKTCLQLATKHFQVALSGLYVRHYFDKNLKSGASYLIENLQNSLDRLIRQENWMDNTTKLAALEKLESMGAFVGYPHELDNNEKINELYENETPHPTSFLKFEMSVRRFEKLMKYSQLKKPVDVLKWPDDSKIEEVGAFYIPDDNSIVLPAGILQGHFYNIDRPNYMNYGAIGFIVGHELSHAFDNDGSQYDKNGNLVNWWKNETRKEYLDRVRCLIEQYGNYTMKEINLTINGTFSQGENIADNIGLKVARYAYNKWTKKHGKETRLPGLPYPSEQMFWISYANNWCAKARPESLKHNILHDVHSPDEARVIGVLSNSREFSKDFKCPLGSPMNPVNKCRIW